MKLECYIDDIRACLRNYGVEDCVIKNMSDYELLECGGIETEEKLDEYIDEIRERIKGV